MARFDVYRNAAGEGYLLDVQSDLLAGLSTRVVGPLMPVALAPRPAERLNPVFQFDGDTVVMVTQFLAAVPQKELGRSLGSLEAFSDDISAALDMLFLGF
ncbi:CcdB family protein [Luminiphilus sp.]|nr:CcdB family protein [Luminiphilus sp.]MDA9722028.1 CcdB family protein [Luminiphilus sp.]MDC3015807.1 CcdB family protein [Luminiphilus sp.]